MALPSPAIVHNRVHVNNPKEWCGLCKAANWTPPSKSTTTPKGLGKRRKR